VFRSPTDTPYDHTSILATLRDWLPIPADRMLTSARITNAPTLAQVLTLDVPREDLPEIAEPSDNFKQPSLSESLNDLQVSLVAGNARRFGLDPHQVLAPMMTRAHAVEFLSRIVSHGTPDTTE
jgi:phospholipase C